MPSHIKYFDSRNMTAAKLFVTVFLAENSAIADQGLFYPVLVSTSWSL